ncbi:MAG: hypothetical protein ACQEQI_07870 [Bacillota bacterium]
MSEERSLQIGNILDRLRILIEDGDQLPLTNKILISADELLGLLDRLEEKLPEDIEAAEEIIAKREEILSSANQEVEKRIEEEVAQTDIVAEAENRAEEIVTEAKEVAQEIRSGVDEYGLEVLSEVEGILSQQLEEVRRSKQELK